MYSLMTNLRIFISSVQKEFAEERRLLKRYIAKNPAYRRFFDTFVFEEDVVVADRRTDEVCLGGDQPLWADVCECCVLCEKITSQLTHVRK